MIFLNLFLYFKTIVFVEKYSNPDASADNITTSSDSTSKVDNDNSAEPNQNSEQIKMELLQFLLLK